MVDLSQDPDVAKVLNHFHQAGKPTVFICHGPIALVSTVKDPKAFVLALEKGDTQKASQLATGWPYAGYKMTIFPRPRKRPPRQMVWAEKCVFTQMLPSLPPAESWK